MALHLTPRDGSIFGTINRDVLWHDPCLHHAHLGMLASAFEERRGLDAVTCYLLLVTVYNACLILQVHFGLLFFDLLLFFRGARFSQLLLFLQITHDVREVKVFQLAV